MDARTLKGFSLLIERLRVEDLHLTSKDDGVYVWGISNDLNAMVVWRADPAASVFARRPEPGRCYKINTRILREAAKGLRAGDRAYLVADDEKLWLAAPDPFAEVGRIEKECLDVPRVRLQAKASFWVATPETFRRVVDRLAEVVLLGTSPRCDLVVGMWLEESPLAGDTYYFHAESLGIDAEVNLCLERCATAVARDRLLAAVPGVWTRYYGFHLSLHGTGKPIELRWETDAGLVSVWIAEEDWKALRKAYDRILAGKPGDTALDADAVVYARAELAAGLPLRYPVDILIVDLDRGRVVLAGADARTLVLPGDGYYYVHKPKDVKGTYAGGLPTAHPLLDLASLMRIDYVPLAQVAGGTLYLWDAPVGGRSEIYAGLVTVGGELEVGPVECAYELSGPAARAARRVVARIAERSPGLEVTVHPDGTVTVPTPMGEQEVASVEPDRGCRHEIRVPAGLLAPALTSYDAVHVKLVEHGGRRITEVSTLYWTAWVSDEPLAPVKAK